MVCAFMKLENFIVFLTVFKDTVFICWCGITIIFYGEFKSYFLLQINKKKLFVKI